MWSKRGPMHERENTTFVPNTYTIPYEHRKTETKNIYIYIYIYINNSNNNNISRTQATSSQET